MKNNSVTPALGSPLNSLYGENPLLASLGPRIAFRDIPVKLASRPLNDYELIGLDATDREELLILYKQNFAPTTTGIDIAAALQNLHREHYWQRHPNNPRVSRDHMRIAQFIRSKNFDPKLVPWLDTSASGMIIKGITGMGKTSVINRYTSLLEEQVREHTNEGIPGFSYIKQIVWLKVDMSSDGSRNGFLTSILLEVDRLVDTNYAKQYAGRYSVDKLAIVVSFILSTHFCGLLIIEEIQEKNFNNSKWHNDLTTFFLRILNFGIPTVLLGNPLGFTELEKSSQNVRRLSSGGIFEINPSPEGTDMDFRNLVDQSLLFNVMERQNPSARDHFRDVAYAYSGGITDFLVRLNIESQLIALRCGEKEVLPKHVNSAFMSPRLAPNHTLIGGLVKKDLNTLRKCTDIPVERFLEIWLKLEERKTEQESKPKKAATRKFGAAVDASAEKEETEETSATEAAVLNEPGRPENQKKGHPLVKRFKAEQTREATKRKRADDQLGRFAAGDIRGEGASTSLVAGLKDLLHGKKKA